MTSTGSIMEVDVHNVTQLIDEDGVFNAAGLDNFVKKVKLAECGVSYAVVAIMGPQSSGKSTLMNHLFKTNFKAMNAQHGRNQTTQGIWLAECVGIEPFTIVMDLEGNDGKERGQEIAFEKQAALFALAISDILMINMRSCNVGLENAANKPLLKTIFEVMLQSLGLGRQTTLMFVLRDLEETPLDVLQPSLLKDIHKIWDEVSKPPSHELTPFSDVFRVEVVGLSHYVHEKKKFMEEVALLRQRFQRSICPGGLAGGGREAVVPALEFSFSSQQLWNVIKENQNLNLPNPKVMISNVRCEEIANNKLDQLRQNQVWLELKRDVEIAPVSGFGEKLSLIIAACVSEYEVEVQYFDKKVRKTKRKEVLERKALDEVYPAYEAMLGHLRYKAFENFKAKLEQSNKKEQLFQSVYTDTESAIAEFDRGSRECLVVINNNERTRSSNVPFHKESSVVKWDASNIRDKLRNDINAHAISLFMGQVFEEKRTVGSTTLYGGPGGHNWDDGLYHSVREITLRSGKCIDSFGVVYHKNGQIHAPAHGGHGGGLTTITLGPSEFLKTVSGHLGVADFSWDKELVIRSLKFETNIRAYGPFGEELGSDRFTFTVKDGDKIIGFFGRSGKFLDAIGIHVETHP